MNERKGDMLNLLTDPIIRFAAGYPTDQTRAAHIGWRGFGEYPRPRGGT